MSLLGELLSHVVFGPRKPAAGPSLRSPAEPLADAPKGFLLGAATSAHQIEGSLENDWTDWERGRFPDGRPHILDGATSQPAADSWNRWREDLAALRALGANAYRLGVEWARLEPAEGAYDGAAAARYREMLEAYRAAGITPMVTLYHFTLPRWVAARGGWEHAGTVESFRRFAAYCGRTFGDLVDLWCTVNEPNVLAMKAYSMGEWAPGARDTARAAHVQAALLRGHAAAASALREHDRTDADGDGHATRIGLAQHLRVFQPATRNPLDFLLARASAEFFNDAFPASIAAGRVQVSVPGVVRIDQPCEGLAGSLDWYGVNYYSRDFVAFDPRRPLMPRLFTPERRPKNDLHWEIYPEGLTRVLLESRRWGWPLYVTENGVADRTGSQRAAFLRAHLFAVDRARAAGADVRGYFHWSLLDNFEWSEGYTGRFGLFSVDFEHDRSLARRPTSGVAEFQAAARRLGLGPPPASEVGAAR